MRTNFDLDTKSIGTVDDSYDSGKSSAGGSKRTEAKRARQMAKLKRRMENAPQRKLLFRPRVYESWREGDQEDEVAERERLLKDIAAKEARLLMKRRLKEEGGEDIHSDSSEDNEVIKALDRLKSRREREDDYKLKLETDQKRREDEAALELEEKLASELQNPSVYGWYFTDGYYDTAPYFGVKEDLVAKFVQDQEAFREKWNKRYPETFTDKFKKFFWPPQLRCKGKIFRTRGSYLDFPEVIADWPKLTADVNFERDPREYITNRHELFGVDKSKEEEAEEDNELEEARLLAEAEAMMTGETIDAELVQSKLASIKLGQKQKILLEMEMDYGANKDMDAHHYYYDDDEGEFFRKKLGFEGDYYHDGLCWRHKRKRGKYKSENQQTPYDYYFDDSSREFKAREEFKGLDEIVYDHKTGVYRIHLISTPIKKEKKTRSGKIVLEFPEYKDETDDEVRRRYKPTSYYFDEEFGKWILRSHLPDNVSSADISWDDHGKRYARKFEGPWRGLTGLTPDDYYFNDRGSKFLPKPARQADSFKYFPADGIWRKTDDSRAMTSARSDDVARFYFDDFEGQFKVKDLTEGSNARYLQGRYSKIWHRVPKPKSGLYPTDFYWDVNKKRWLPRSVRMEMLRNAEVTRQKKIVGAQPGVWDIKAEKDLTRDDFYFDYEEGIYLKKAHNEEYIFSDVDKCWTLGSHKDKPKLTRFHHEYYFDTKDNAFVLKNADQTFEYDQKFHVWKKGGEDLSKSSVDKWYFDLNQETWLQKDSSGGIRYDPMLNINVVPHKDSNFRSPDDYFFKVSEGRFYAKEGELAMAGFYVYDSGDGAWKQKDAKGPSPNNLTPRSFFFHDHEKTFKLRISGRDKDYWYDTRNKIYRHIAASGKSKSGYKPSDFIWNNEFRTYVPTTAVKRGRVDAPDEIPKWDPLRTYDKPWITAAPMRNPDAPKADDLTSTKSGGGGWFGLGGSSNKVAPSKSSENKDDKNKDDKSKDAKSKDAKK